MAQRFIGIDLGTRSVKIALISGGFRGTAVLASTSAEVVLQDGESRSDASTRTALALLREHGWMEHPVGVALPDALCSYRLLEFPFKDAKRIAAAVEFEVDGEFPFPADDTTCSHMVLPAAGEGGRALAVAARSSAVTEVIAPLADAGLRIRMITAGPLGMARAVLPTSKPAKDEDLEAVRLVVDLGSRSTSFVALGARTPVGVRSVRRGLRHVQDALAKVYRLDAEDASQIMRESAFLPHEGVGELSEEQRRSADITAAALEPVVRELEHTRIWLQKVYGYRVDSIHVTGGGAALTGFVEYLEEQLSTPVELLSLREGITAEAGAERFATAIGVGDLARTGRGVQLYTVRTGVTTDHGWLEQQLPSIGLMAAALVAFASLEAVASVKGLRAERDAYAAELADATQTVFGETIEDPAEVVERMSDVGTGDITSVVPKKSALDVLALIAKASQPTDEPPAPPPPGATPTPTDIVLGATGAPPPPTPAAAASAADPDADPNAAPELAPITDATQGIVHDDALIFDLVDVRERRVQVRASATRSSAQDRLAAQFEKTECLSRIDKGKVRDRNDRKVFEMEMDNRCFGGADASKGGK